METTYIQIHTTQTHKSTTNLQQTKPNRTNAGATQRLSLAIPDMANGDGGGGGGGWVLNSLLVFLIACTGYVLSAQVKANAEAGRMKYH